MGVLIPRLGIFCKMNICIFGKSSSSDTSEHWCDGFDLYGVFAHLLSYTNVVLRTVIPCAWVSSNWVEASAALNRVTLRSLDTRCYPG